MKRFFKIILALMIISIGLIMLNDGCKADYFFSSQGSGGMSAFGGGGFSGGGSRGNNYSLPELPLDGYTLWLRNPYVERIRPQCGPGYEYSVFASKNGNTRLYKPYDITYLEAKFCVGSWVYVKFGYTDGVLRYGFFEKSLFDSSVSWSSIPSYSLNFEKHGTINQTTIPYNGPGTYCGSYESCKLYSGNTVHACMECDGWYLCRFYNDHSNNYGEIYLWVPGYNIRWN